MQKAMATAAGVHALRDEYTRSNEPARALAAETLNLKPAGNAKTPRGKDAAKVIGDW